MQLKSMGGKTFLKIYTKKLNDLIVLARIVILVEWSFWIAEVNWFKNVVNYLLLLETTYEIIRGDIEYLRAKISIDQSSFWFTQFL